MRNSITSGKSHVQVQVAAATHGFKTVLFTTSRGNNFVGSTLVHALRRVPF